MGENEVRFRAAEQRLWQSVGVAPTEQPVHLPRTGCTVRILEAGEGPPVVFVHGASNGGSSWASLVARLDGYRCIMLDRPGCGLSDRIPAQLNGFDGLQSYADELIPDLLDALGLASAHVAATSFGGYFAFRTASAHPERVDKLVEFSWTTGAPMAKIPMLMRIGSAPGAGWLMARVPPTVRAVKMMLRQIGLGAAIDSGRFTQESLDWYVALLRHTHTMRNDIEALPKLMSPIRGIDERLLLSPAVLAGVGAPTFLLWGEDDPNGGADIARRFAGMLPNADLELMPGVGHAPWMDDPDHAARATQAFLDR